MTPRDLADLLLAKARQDLMALTLLASDPKVADEIIGFHAQQAVEKALKAVLTATGVRSGKAHDPAQLIALLSEAQIDIPDWLNATADFEQYAVTGRYVEIAQDEPLDRSAAVDLVEHTLEWAAGRVAEIDSA